MAMDTYTLLKAEVIDWLNRTGFSSLENKVENFIAMGQRRIHRTCDLNAMETVFPVFAQSTETKAVPSDFLRVKTLTFRRANSNVEIAGTAYKKVVQAGRSGTPRYYSVVGTNFHFGPIPDSEVQVDLVYYAALDVLSPTVSTNWISENAPELLLFASLLEAALWLKDDKRAQIWTTSYEQIKKELLESEARQDLEGGSLQVREMTPSLTGGNQIY